MMEALGEAEGKGLVYLSFPDGTFSYRIKTRLVLLPLAK